MRSPTFGLGRDVLYVVRLLCTSWCDPGQYVFDTCTMELKSNYAFESCVSDNGDNHGVTYGMDDMLAACCLLGPIIR